MVYAMRYLGYWMLVLVLLTQGLENSKPAPLLYVSTLDGTFYAIDSMTGHQLWEIQEEQVVSIPSSFQENQKFFPDPLDGSLYVVNRGSIEKLAHTIPEMVNNSPMKTTNGLLYAGKKTDFWVALDPVNGNKHASVTTQGVETCTAVTKEESSLFVGKTEYSLTIVDSKTATQTWNVTYVSYVAPTLNDYDYKYTHYASSSDGLLITFNTASNRILWHVRFASPVISLFVERFKSLVRVPHRTVAVDTMTSYIVEDIRSLIYDHQKDVVNCLFIGRYAGGIYAMNEMMHAHNVDKPRPHYPSIGSSDQGVQTIGRHVLPMLPDHLLISHVAEDIQQEHHSTDNRVAEQLHPKKEDPVQLYLIIAVGVIVILVIVVFVVMFLLYLMIQSLNNRNSLTYPRSDNDCKPASKHIYTVGKIDVHLSDIIGHGSEGTVVFKGVFERRDVAVKRVLLDFIDIDLHEVELLRQADEHPNVIRYFCMETDSMFRYLALELCQASLRHYVENSIFCKSKAQNKSLLYQTISGLCHLHSLNIVHRDIKPGNILITKDKRKRNTLKAIISDFGLCRKISDGRQSLTARTGSAGTDGWIAPEMLAPSTKISCAVDIFSYGCIMYYVLSGGQHPFGNDVYRRQNNIRDFDYDLSCLAEATQDNVLAVSLIVKMVGSQEQAARPTANCIAMHPYFWDPAKQLSFYSDVSDRVEKEETSDLVLRWEHNCVGQVLRGGWMIHCPELHGDLQKYRKYRTDSVRDLLRAMRNKRHHYRELPEDLKATLGDIPDGYMLYFSSRFPRLLLHTYTIMWECAAECVFRQYYPEISTFHEERLEMPRYHTPDIVSSSVEPTKLALNTAGDYSTGEVIKPLAPLTSDSATPDPRKKSKSRTKENSDEPSSRFWRRTSDSSPQRKPFSSKTHPKASGSHFELPMENKFDVIADPEPEPSAPPGFSDTPWFHKFATRPDDPLPTRRKSNRNET